MLVVDAIRHIDRREGIGMGIVPCFAVPVLDLGVRGERHTAVFEPDAGINVPAAEGQVDAGISRRQDVVALVAVAVVAVVVDIELVGAIITVLQNIVDHIAVSEVRRQVVRVEAIEIGPGAIIPRTVFAVESDLQFGGERRTFAQGAGVVDARRSDVFAQFHEVAPDLVLIDLHLTVVRIAHHVVLLPVDDAAVGLVLVGVGISGIPVQSSQFESMYTRYLPAVRAARGVAILRFLLDIERRHILPAFAQRELVLSDLVENVTEIVAILSVQVSQIQQGAHFDVGLVLVVGIFVVVFGFVLHLVVNPVTGVFHIREGPGGIAVIERSVQRQIGAVAQAEAVAVGE